MPNNPDNEWALLNAYADGELDAARTAQIEARLRTRPELRHELGRIRDLKHQLGLLQPSDREAPAPAPAPARKAGVLSRPLPAAIAACIALAIAAVIAGFALFQPSPPAWFAKANAMHQRLSQSAYVVEERGIERIVSSGHALEFRAPDLTGSRLFLVDVVTSRGGDDEQIAIHYRGMRGCRLTVAAIYDGQELAEPSSTNDLMRVWAYGGFKFAVIANGMDPVRFASIADYAKAAIEDDDRKRGNLRLAMSESYGSARPCA